jgi:Putative Ig domain
VVAHNAKGTSNIRLYDPLTFAERGYPIDDPSAPTFRGFPLGVTRAPNWVATGADGRVIMLGNRYYIRADDRYRGGALPNTGEKQHLPLADGSGFVGTRLYGADAALLPPAAVPFGSVRRYVPAASGPFVVSAEYKEADPSSVKLFLHLGTDSKPLGPLPGGEEVAAWAKDDKEWATKLAQRLVFAPDPGQLIFCAPDSDLAHVYPVNLSALLAASGRGVAFTSTPPAEARPGTAYSYQATAAGEPGPITFALEAGPPGMTVTRAGALSWPQPGGEQTSHEVRLVATTASGKKAVQSFRVFLPRKGAELKQKPPEDKKEEPNPFDPKKP